MLQPNIRIKKKITHPIDTKLKTVRTIIELKREQMEIYERTQTKRFKRTRKAEQKNGINLEH